MIYFFIAQSYKKVTQMPPRRLARRIAWRRPVTHCIWAEGAAYSATAFAEALPVTQCFTLSPVIIRLSTFGTVNTNVSPVAYRYAYRSAYLPAAALLGDPLAGTKLPSPMQRKGWLYTSSVWLAMCATLRPETWHPTNREIGFGEKAIID